MYTVFLVAALARCRNVLCRVAKGDDGVGHNGLRQSEQLLLGLYPVHLGPGAQPDCAKPQLLCSKADVLGGNGSVNDPVVLCKAERTVKVASDEDTGGCFSQRLFSCDYPAQLQGLYRILHRLHAVARAGLQIGLQLVRTPLTN